MTSKTTASSASAPASASSLQHKPHRVLVLGAGMSGLACARELQQRNYKVLVVEARRRVGGRLKGEALQVAPLSSSTSSTSTIAVAEVVEDGRSSLNGLKQPHKPGAVKKAAATATVASASSADTIKQQQQQQPQPPQHAIDMGGALIHGIKDNPLYGLVQDMGDIPVQSVSDCLLLDDSGWPVDPKDDEKVQTVFNECLDESFRRIQQQKVKKEEESKQQQPKPTPEDNHNAVVVETTDASITATATEAGVATATRSSTHSPTTAAAPSTFGDLFQTVCREKKADVLPQKALLKWHQANLEVSCGASFDRLGWEWNEDEPYGFDGAHVAIQPSWNAVTERLAEPLDILYQAVVTRIQIIHPPAPTTSNTGAAADGGNEEHTNTKRKSARIASAVAAAAVVVKPSAAPVIMPTRISRRLRGEDASVRRSLRCHRPPVNRFTVQHDEPPQLASRRRNNHGGKSSSTLGTASRKRSHSAVVSSSSASSASSHPWSVVQVTIQLGPSKKTLVLQADAVVCTLPLGVLQLEPSQGGIVFDPPLPVEKQQAISRLGTGLLNKCALSFSHVFWQKADFLGWAESEHSSYLVLNGAVTTGGHPVLIFLYGGNFARDIEEWTDQQIVDDCLTVLHKICGRRKVPPPLDYCVTRWGKEVHSRMAFTYIPPGVDGFAELRTMSQPVYGRWNQRPTNRNHAVDGTTSSSETDIPILMFAGEHTTPFHPSTIHGAFLSGIREAYRYDCAVDSEAIGNLRFSENELYQRTFSVTPPPDATAIEAGTFQADSVVVDEPEEATVATTAAAPRRTKGTKADSQATTNSTTAMAIRQRRSDHQFHRRRGASGIMTMRQESESSNHQQQLSGSASASFDSNGGGGGSEANTTSIPSAAAAATTAEDKLTSTSKNEVRTAIRRSHRGSAGQHSKSRIHEVESEDKNEHQFKNGESVIDNDTAAMEDRMLLRSLDSYGPNYNYIYQCTIPVRCGRKVNGNHHNTTDNTNTTTLAQIRSRCQKLARSAEAKPPSRVKNWVLKTWIAKHVVSSVSEEDNRHESGNEHSKKKKKTQKQISSATAAASTTTTTPTHKNGEKKSNVRSSGRSTRKTHS